jgi:branched-chain amino acid transport system permease protein
MNRRAVLIVVALMALSAYLAPALLNRYWLFLVTSLLAYVVALAGLKVLFGDAGQLSLGQAAFIGIGAYTAAIVSEQWKLTLPYELLVVIVVCGAIAGLIAIPALRVSGLRFALLTLAFAELFQWVLREAKGVTGGEQGLYVPPLLMGPIDGKSQTTLFILALVLAGVASLLAVHLPTTRVGRAMAAIRESRLAAESVGVSVWRTKLFAFIFAAVLAGVAGLLIAHSSGSLSPTSFDLFDSVYLLVAIILGGLRSVLGAWIGAAYLVIVPAIFTQFGLESVYVVLSGAVLLVVIMIFPSGIAGVIKTGVARLSPERRSGSRGSQGAATDHAEDVVA